MRTDMKVGPRTLQERAVRAPFWVKKSVAHSDLTDTVDGEAQAITLLSLPANHGVIGVQTRLRTAFKNTAEAGNDTTTVEVGDAGDADRNLTAIEINENGTEIPLKLEFKSTGGIVSQSAATTVTATFTPKAATNLAELDTGVIDIFLLVVDFDLLNLVGDVD